MENELVSRLDIIRILKDGRESYTLLVAGHEFGHSHVILKIVRRRSFGANEDSLSKFFSWHQGIDHNYFAHVFSSGLTSKGDLYYVREYLPESNLSLSAKSSFLKQLLDAVAFLHSRRLIHGRLVPSNVFVSSIGLKLADPQIPSYKSQDVTAEDIPFTAPEILNGGESTSESDMYAVGALLYRFYSGKDPFDDIDLSHLRAKYIWAKPKPLISTCNVSKAVSDAIDLLLGKQPEKRKGAFLDLQQTVLAERLTARRAPFVGRQREMEQAQAFLTNTQEGLSALLVQGRAGIGKSRFIEELRLRNAFSTKDFVIIRCSESAKGLQPLLEGIECVLRKRMLSNRTNLEQELGGFQSSLTKLFRRDQIEDIGNAINDYPLERVINDLVGLLAKLAREGAMMLAIDDLRHADQAMLLFIQQLSFRSAEVPFHLVLTKRTQDDFPELLSVVTACLKAQFSTLVLEPLPSDTAREIVNYLVSSTSRQDWILSNARGNPFIIEQYAQNQLQRSHPPPPVEKLFLLTLAGVSKDSRHLSDALSLFSVSTESNVLQKVSELSDSAFKTCVDELVRRDIVELTGTRLSFIREAMRLVIYRRLSPPRRISLHKNSYDVIKELNYDVESIAHHAFRGRLFSDAQIHFLTLARNAYQKGRYQHARRFYRNAIVSSGVLDQTIDPKDKIKLAFCYGRTGRIKLAKQIFVALLSELSTVQYPTSEQKALLSSVYFNLAMPDLGSTASEQTQLYTQAIQSLPPGSPEISRLYVALGQAFVRKGDIKSAAEALRLAESHLCELPNERTAQNVKAIRGLIFLHGGQFRECFTVLESVVSSNVESVVSSKPGILMPVLNNLALCAEHLGELERARTFQLQSEALAEESGSATMQVLAQGNLGVFETKLGNFKHALQYFDSAVAALKKFRLRDRQFARDLSIVRSDAAFLYLETGRYLDAIENLKDVARDRTLGFENDSLQIALTKCELNLRLENSRVVPGLLKTIEDSPLATTPFFEVECILIRARLDEMHPELKLQMLAEALDISSESGTLYQRCRILTELVVVSLALAKFRNAEERSIEALHLARSKGFKALAVRLVLLSGLATANSRKKQRRLQVAFGSALKLGMPELVAESAFHIGILQLEQGNHWLAHQYLLKSTIEIDKLLEEVPPKFRAKYLNRPWRKEAQAANQALSKRNLLPTLVAHRLGGAFDDATFVRELYRIAVSATASKDITTFANSVSQALTGTIQHVAVLMISHGEKLIWHGIRTRLSNNLSERVISLSTKAKGRIYFGIGEVAPIKEVIAWIPFQSRDLSGGIYVECRRGQASFSEREMEFLTILGTIVSGALEQIENRKVEGMKEPQVTEFHGIIGSSKAIREVYSQIEIAARNTATVLIEGESGTGKELVAKAIHETGSRSNGPFVAVDCGAIPDGLVEAELFGAKKGSYTGAVTDRPGLFEAAHHGTIFLDEISNTTPSVQAKLLRVLQEREVRRIGEVKGRPIEVRLIVASNANLDVLVNNGTFRKDLLYRLKVLHIKVPPLRSRREDIPMLAHSFLDRFNTANKTRKHFGPGILTKLSAAIFPGNVRELQNAVERAYFSAKGVSINTVSLESPSEELSSTDEVQSWFKELADGRKDFWSAVQTRYKRRDISREKVLALMDFGLRSTRGSYKTMAAMFRLKEKDYRRFMDFLRRNDCLLDFRPYRRGSTGAS